MTGLAVQTVQFKVFVEMRHAEKSLERGVLHQRGMGEAHVVRDQGKNLSVSSLENRNRWQISSAIFTPTWT